MNPCPSCGLAVDPAERSCPACGAVVPPREAPVPGDFKPEHSGMALAALATSILGWLGVIFLAFVMQMLKEVTDSLFLMALWSLLLPFAGATLGAVALREIRADPHRLQGRGLAKAAVFLGLAELLIAFLWYFFLVAKAV